MPKIHQTLFVAACAIAAGAAQAQSQVAVYGLIDLSVDATRNGDSTTYRMLSGAQTGSRVGFRGSEDLGGGNRANFVLENGFLADSGAAATAGTLFNRQAWVGLSGAWGEVRVGRQNSPIYIPLEGKLDATGASTIASGLNSLATLSVRASDALSYQTPNVGGLSAQVLVGLREAASAGANGIGSTHTAVNYLKGPVDVSAGYQKVESADRLVTLRAGFAGASYDFGTVKAFLGYHDARQSDNSVRKRVYTTSAAYRFTPATSASLVYTRLNDRTANGHDADHIGLMGQHWLSKQTLTYVSIAKLRNRHGATYALAASTSPGIAPDRPGASLEGIQVGLQKRF